jgi:hypothetical protein
MDDKWRIQEYPAICWFLEMGYPLTLLIMKIFVCMLIVYFGWLCIYEDICMLWPCNSWKRQPKETKKKHAKNFYPVPCAVVTGNQISFMIHWSIPLPWLALPPSKSLNHLSKNCFSNILCHLITSRPIFFGSRARAALYGMLIEYNTMISS